MYIRRPAPTALVAAFLSIGAMVAAGCFVPGGQQGEGSSASRTQRVASDVSRPPPGVPRDWWEGRLPAEVNEGEPKSGGTLVVRIQSEPPSLNKIVDSDLTTTWMLERKVLQSLAELDASQHPDYPLKPVLAESWDISDDGLTVTFKIRKGVKWHDGKPFSGKDVVATMEKIRDPTVRAMSLRNYFENLESLETLPGDDYTVVAKYSSPYFLGFRSLATLPIYPKHLLDEAGDLMGHPIHRAPVGTGPFKFKEWITGDRIIFERNEDYWGRKAYVDRVVYRMVEDATTAFQLLQKGDFDIYTTIQPQQWSDDMPKIESLVKNYNRVKFYNPNYSWIGWNQKRPFFQDRRVRLAMTYLMDRESMRQMFLLGLDRPTTCHFYPESDSCDPTLDVRPYDREKAIALLDAAGWVDTDGDGIRDKDGVKFEFTFLSTQSSVFLGKLTPYLQQELQKVGIRMEIKRVAWGLFVQMLREHDFDAVSLLWGSVDVISDPYQIWHSTQSKDGSNYISFANEEADRLIEQARVTMDEDERNALYRRLGLILHHENPYTFLYNRPALDVVRKNVRGLNPAVPWYDLQDVWFADAPTAAK